jgi:hypothetical protein
MDVVAYARANPRQEWKRGSKEGAPTVDVFGVKYTFVDYNANVTREDDYLVADSRPLPLLDALAKALNTDTKTLSQIVEHQLTSRARYTGCEGMLAVAIAEGSMNAIDKFIDKLRYSPRDVDTNALLIVLATAKYHIPRDIVLFDLDRDQWLNFNSKTPPVASEVYIGGHGDLYRVYRKSLNGSIRIPRLIKRPELLDREHRFATKKLLPLKTSNTPSNDHLTVTDHLKGLLDEWKNAGATGLRLNENVYANYENADPSYLAHHKAIRLFVEARYLQYTPQRWYPPDNGLDIKLDKVNSLPGVEDNEKLSNLLKKAYEAYFFKNVPHNRAEFTPSIATKVVVKYRSVREPIQTHEKTGPAVAFLKRAAWFYGTVTKVSTFSNYAKYSFDTLKDEYNARFAHDFDFDREDADWLAHKLDNNDAIEGADPHFVLVESPAYKEIAAPAPSAVRESVPSTPLRPPLQTTDDEQTSEESDNSIGRRKVKKTKKQRERLRRIIDSESSTTDATFDTDANSATFEDRVVPTAVEWTERPLWTNTIAGIQKKYAFPKNDYVINMGDELPSPGPEEYESEATGAFEWLIPPNANAFPAERTPPANRTQSRDTARQPDQLSEFVDAADFIDVLYFTPEDDASEAIAFPPSALTATSHFIPVRICLEPKTSFPPV